MAAAYANSDSKFNSFTEGGVHALNSSLYARCTYPHHHSDRAVLALGADAPPIAWRIPVFGGL
jgi:hypothetical protein